MTKPVDPEVFAFFLPQFHPVPENDEWWGPGFTEWFNVTRGRPQFRGHYQPHEPADLGYYDLRVPEIRAKQAQMARQAGIHGFAYYHYWFNGRRILQRPVQDLIASETPNFPFFLVWANENWTRTWDGGDEHILLEQNYSAADDLRHIQALRPIMTDHRYATRNGCPMLAVYRASRLPNSRATTDIWREEVARWGLPGLYLLRIESFRNEFVSPASSGFDANIRWQPSAMNTPPLSAPVRYRQQLSYAMQPFARAERISRRLSHRVSRYDDWADLAMRSEIGDWPSWPTVIPGFDNSARRRRNASIITGSSPATYERWMSWALGRAAEIADNFESEPLPPLVFVNAWNEWAEGNHLEPDRRFGDAYLEATGRAILAARLQQP